MRNLAIQDDSEEAQFSVEVMKIHRECAMTKAATGDKKEDEKKDFLPILHLRKSNDSL